MILGFLLISPGSVIAGFSAEVRPAPMLSLPGVSAQGADPKLPGDIDCNSAAHWDGDRLFMFFSTGHPFRSTGPDLFHLSRPSARVTFDNESSWKQGARWIEATHKAADGKLYMWYHNEPPIPGGKTAPRIGQMVSMDNGLNWHDQGLILETPAGSDNPESPNFYFVGGNGDFCVNPDLNNQYLYFFISTYNKDIAQQGVAVARMCYADRDNPVGKVFKYHKGSWAEPGLGGLVTPIFSVKTDWHREDVDAFWGPSIHWNTHLRTFVMLLNRAKDKNWAQEGIYISFNPHLENPEGWSKPEKILDAADLEKSKWYPQVIGLEASARQTDKLAGKTARLFVAGLSKWELVFSTNAEQSSSEAPAVKPEDRSTLASDAAERKILDVLRSMESNPALKRMNIDPPEGRLLRILTESTDAQTVVEIGTSYGYSGLWFCLALRKTGGKLITHDLDPVRFRHSADTFTRAGVESMVVQILDDAHDAVAHLQGPIDLVLLDADKEGNIDYLNKLLPKIRPGGLLIAHNTVSHRDAMPDYLDAITSRTDLETQFLNLTGQGMAITLKKR
jgi:predicted O-methyltransferase YrrM